MDHLLKFSAPSQYAEPFAQQVPHVTRDPVETKSRNGAAGCEARNLQCLELREIETVNAKKITRVMSSIRNL